MQTLQRRNKWNQIGENLKIGDLVLIIYWPLARVIEVHPGQDNLARYVTVKTASSAYKRPVQKLIPLKLNNDK